MSTAMPEVRPVDRLGAPETRRFLNDFVKRRVGESHVDDIVQTVLVNALESDNIPASESELRRWLTGIAKHKIADLHRKSGRERPEELLEIEAPAPPIEERLMTEWAEKQVNTSKDATRTLEWMAREGEGEKLEHIAAEERIEAATVRQRVSRMRRWMKERWLAELAAAAVLGVLALLAWQWLRKKPAEIVREVPTAEAVGPLDQAKLLRKSALDACAADRFDECIRGLDQAKDLDPAGDETPEVQSAREKAKRPVEAPSAIPTSTQTPRDVPSATPSAAPSAAPPVMSAAPTTSFTTPSVPKKPTSDAKGDELEKFKKMNDKPAPKSPPTKEAGPTTSLDSGDTPAATASSFTGTSSKK
jgi:RNA polymerase sigma factor (sigma-70 family)